MSTIVSQTLSNGSVSTSTTNVIQGCAKAWVSFGYISAAISVRQSFNVSSVTRSGAGTYTVNFTTALPNANYIVTGSASSSATNYPGNSFTWFTTGAGSPNTFSRSTTACNVQSPYVTGVAADVDYLDAVFFTS